MDADRKLFLQVFSCIGDVVSCNPVVKAVIVRVMKSRKVLKHNLLIQEVLLLNLSLFLMISDDRSFHWLLFILAPLWLSLRYVYSNLPFSSNVDSLQSVIEALIDKQYIRRSDTSPNEYHYLA